MNHRYSSVVAPSKIRSADPAMKPVSVVCDVLRVTELVAFIETWNSDTDAGLVIDSVRIQPVSQSVIWRVAVAS